MDLNVLFSEATGLLKKLIETPSFSREEHHTADIIEAFLGSKSIPCTRVGNNILSSCITDISLSVLLLNSHHDTVKPNKGYTLDPFAAIEKEGKLFGLGSNDAGGCLVSLAVIYAWYYHHPPAGFNLQFIASAEEEISGVNGIELALKHAGHIDAAIVGEPTLMDMAVAERGLMVLDCTAQGMAGHAARNEGENALYKALDDIQWLRQYHFEKISGLLGPNQVTATVIHTDNRQHNVVPPQCEFVLDVRLNELYSFEEVLDIFRAHMHSRFTPRSLRLRSTSIPIDHPLVKSGLSLGKKTYGSPTTSDKALMPFPALKMGPGFSGRSHSADEFIFLEEIESGIRDYAALISGTVF